MKALKQIQLQIQIDAELIITFWVRIEVQYSVKNLFGSLKKNRQKFGLNLPQPGDPQETRTPGFVWLLQVPHFQTP